MTDQQIQQLILSEVRSLRTSFEDHKEDSIQRLSKLETHVSSIVGDMQPGRMTLAEKSIKELQQWKWRIGGIAVGVSTVISAIIGILIHFV